MDLAKIRKKLREARHKAESGASEGLPSEDDAPKSGGISAASPSEPHKEIAAVPAETGLSGQTPELSGVQAGVLSESGPGHEDLPGSFETLSLDDIAAEKSGVTEEQTSGSAPSGAVDDNIKSQLQPQPEAEIPVRKTADWGPERAQSPMPEVPETPKAFETAAAPGEAETNEAEKEKARQKNVEILTFRLGGEDYAFRIEDIEEILKPQQITKVPRMGASIRGISSLRGKIIPVMDLKIRLGLKGDSLPEKLARVLILRGPKGSIGVCVDMVEDVLRIPASLVQDPPSHLSEIEVKYLEGVALFNGKFISIMKTGEVLSVRDAV